MINVDPVNNSFYRSVAIHCCVLLYGKKNAKNRTLGSKHAFLFLVIAFSTFSPFGKYDHVLDHVSEYVLDHAHDPTHIPIHGPIRGRTLSTHKHIFMVQW